MNLPLELNKRLLSEAQSSSTKPQAAPPNPSSPACCHRQATAMSQPRGGPTGTNTSGCCPHCVAAPLGKGHREGSRSRWVKIATAEVLAPAPGEELKEAKPDPPQPENHKIAENPLLTQLLSWGRVHHPEKGRRMPGQDTSMAASPPKLSTGSQLGQCKGQQH